MPGKILFRADGGSTIGLGHVARCLALIEMLGEDFDCSFAIQHPGIKVIEFIRTVCKNIIQLPPLTDIDSRDFKLDDYDIIVLDGYDFTQAFQQRIKGKKKLVYIDDLHQWNMVADAVINHSGAASEEQYTTEPYTRLYLGSQYALLRKPFLEAARQTRTISKIENVVISMGGADPNNITHKVLKALENTPSITNVHVLIGAANKHRPELTQFAQGRKDIQLHLNLSPVEYCNLLKSSDMIICPASTTSMEACAVGMVICSGFTADNQTGILSGLEKQSAIYNLGELNRISESDLASGINKAIADKRNWGAQLAAQRKLVDGKSSERIREIFKQLYAQV